MIEITRIVNRAVALELQ